MGLFKCVIILVINQMVSSAPTNSKLAGEVFTIKCHNLLQKDLVQECLNASFVDINQISDINKEHVLCTIYLYHLSEFSNKLSSQNCNETLLFPVFEENSAKICSEPNFLLLNETKKELTILRHKCSKLCFNWNNEVNKKCELAHYYENFKFDLPNNIDQQDVINNKSKKVEHAAVQKIHSEQNTKLNTTNQIVKNVTAGHINETVDSSHEFNIDGKNQINKAGNANGDQIVHTSETLGSSNHIEEKKFNPDNGANKNDAHQNVGTTLNIVDNEISNSSVINNSSIQKIIKLSEQSSAQLTTEKNEWSSIENEDHSVFGDNANAGTDNLGQEFTKDDPERMEKPNTVAGDTPVNSLNTDMDGKSYFFSYFLLVCILFVMGYIFYHNRVKVMALVLEGKKTKRQHRKRRPNSANYHKLDSNLEEALSSNCNKNTNQIIY